MKFGLERIGAMLEQLNTQNDVPSPSPPACSQATHPIASTSMPRTLAEPRTHSDSDPFPLPLQATSHHQCHSEPLPLPVKTSSDKSGATLFALPGASPAEVVQPFPAQGTQSLALPHAKAVSLSHHRHATNPNLAISLLKDIETTVVAWQLELEQIILQIQAVYADGPIVEGWLESQASQVQPQPSASSEATATLRHGEVDRLMDYVEAICNSNLGSQSQGSQAQVAQSQGSQSQGQASVRTPEDSCTAYRLCGLDADGRLWSRSCPTPQVPYVSLAIARYQKLRILLGQKQTLENRLNQLIQSLTVLSGQIQKS